MPFNSKTDSIYLIIKYEMGYLISNSIFKFNAVLHYISNATDANRLHMEKKLVQYESIKFLLMHKIDRYGCFSLKQK